MLFKAAIIPHRQENENFLMNFALALSTSVCTWFMKDIIKSNGNILNGFETMDILNGWNYAT